MFFSSAVQIRVWTNRPQLSWIYFILKVEPSHHGLPICCFDSAQSHRRRKRPFKLNKHILLISNQHFNYILTMAKWQQAFFGVLGQISIHLL